LENVVAPLRATAGRLSTPPLLLKLSVIEPPLYNPTGPPVIETEEPGKHELIVMDASWIDPERS
jgi:hypothetical protein